MDWHAHLLVRGSIFSRNKADTDNHSIIVRPGKFWFNNITSGVECAAGAH